MWKPNYVVAEHRKRANLLWAGLLLGVLTYTMWQIKVVWEKRANPSTSLMLSNELFKFPDVWVCVEDLAGCGYTDYSTEACVASALEFSYMYYNDEYHMATIAEGNCVVFNLSRYDVGEGEKVAQTEALIEMSWISSDNSSMEIQYSTSVRVGLGDSENVVEYTTVPYSRNVQSKDVNVETFGITDLTIGKTQRSYISGESTVTYPILTISTTSYVTENNFFSSSSAYFSSHSTSSLNLADEYSVGTLYMSIVQGSYSLTRVKDVNPLEIGTLIGNIGGVWEILIVIWGFFFIASSRDAAPTMKGRNFAKSIQRGSSRVVRKRQNRSVHSSSSIPPESAEHQPAWDDVYISSGSETGGDKSGRFHREVSSVDASSVDARSRRPIASDLPHRASEFPSMSNSVAANEVAPEQRDCHRLKHGSNGRRPMSSQGHGSRRGIPGEMPPRRFPRAAEARRIDGVLIPSGGKVVSGTRSTDYDQARSGFFSSRRSVSYDADERLHSPAVTTRATESASDGCDEVGTSELNGTGMVTGSVDWPRHGRGGAAAAVIRRDESASNNPADAGQGRHWAISNASTAARSSEKSPSSRYFAPSSDSFKDLPV